MESHFKPKNRVDALLVSIVDKLKTSLNTPD
jgi:CRP-like cAMP-binding protein